MPLTSCAVFCFRDGRLLGVETVNRPADHMAARRLVGARAALSPAQAADETIDLKKLIVPSTADVARPASSAPRIRRAEV